MIPLSRRAGKMNSRQAKSLVDAVHGNGDVNSHLAQLAASLGQDVPGNALDAKTVGKSCVLRE